MQDFKAPRPSSTSVKIQGTTDPRKRAAASTTEASETAGPPETQLHPCGNGDRKEAAGGTLSFLTDKPRRMAQHLDLEPTHPLRPNFSCTNKLTF